MLASLNNARAPGPFSIDTSCNRYGGEYEYKGCRNAYSQLIADNINSQLFFYKLDKIRMCIPWPSAKDAFLYKDSNIVHELAIVFPILCRKYCLKKARAKSKQVIEALSCLYPLDIFFTELCKKQS